MNASNSANIKPGSKAALNAKSDELVTELQAIRAHVAEKRTPTSTPGELADLQGRLFEVWVADKLALTICQQEQAIAELQAAKLQVTELRKELVAAQKDVIRLGKLTEKLTGKLESMKAAKAARKK